MKSKFVALSAAIAAAGAFAASPAVARDHVKIVGSSTVYPYAQAVSEEVTKSKGIKAPVLESTGTGGGMKIFCQGVGEQHPDVTNASRAMKESEWATCTKNGVTDITEVHIGFDGLSIALSKAGPDLDLTKEQIFKALAAKVPVDGKLVDNPYKLWSDVDASLPKEKITVYGPPPTSGTRDAFVELAMHKGCAGLDYFKAKKGELDKKAYKKLIKAECTSMRQDGPFIEAGENDNLIVQRLVADPKALGIFGYSFLFENQDKLKPVKVKGVEPSFETIADGSYGISRPLFFYIKNAHRGVIPGLKEYTEEFVSETAFGPDGYLKERGLVSLSDDKRKAIRDAVVNGKGMARFTN